MWRRILCPDTRATRGAFSIAQRALKLGNAYELDGCTLWLYAREIAIRIQRSEPIDSCKNRKQNFVEIHQSIVLISLSHGIPQSPCRYHDRYILPLRTLHNLLIPSPLPQSEPVSSIVPGLEAQPGCIFRLYISCVVINLSQVSIPGVIISSCRFVRIRINLNSSFQSASLPKSQTDGDRTTHSLITFPYTLCCTAD